MNCEVCGIDYGLYIMPYQPVGDVTVCGPCAARVKHVWENQRVMARTKADLIALAKLVP